MAEIGMERGEKMMVMVIMVMMDIGMMVMMIFKNPTFGVGIAENESDKLVSPQTTTADLKNPMGRVKICKRNVRKSCENNSAFMESKKYI